MMVAATPAHAASVSGRVGLSTHLFWLGESDAQYQLTRLRASGIDWVREDFRWDLLEPRKGTMDWSHTDALMTAAARTDTNVLAILDYSATWASSDPSGAGSIYYPPKDPADYAAYARRVVERYGPGGTFWAAHPELPAKPLGGVELWNEPWGSWFWKPGPDPAAYARLAKAAAIAVKAASPSVPVLLSGDILQIRADGSSAPWLDAVLAADPSLRSVIDAYSTHPYPSPRNRSPLDTSMPAAYRFDRAQLTHDVAAKYDADKPIWITEVGWSTATGVPDAVSEDTQATYLRDAVTSALGRQAVQRIFVFGWDKSSGVSGDREGNYGLQRADGSFKPGWSALTSIESNGLAAVSAPSPAPVATPTPAPVATPTPTPVATPTPTPTPVATPTPTPVKAKSCKKACAPTAHAAIALVPRTETARQRRQAKARMRRALRSARAALRVARADYQRGW
jgi:hypothetical protein